MASANAADGGGLEGGAQTFASEPFYRPLGDEIEVFARAYENRLPVLLKGPTGCGKTRFMEHMAWRLKKPLITVACHDDLTASDLVGRYLLKDDATVWADGPLTRSVRKGCLCYLDEVVEARKDTIVVIHPLCDDRRVLPVEKRSELIRAHADFSLSVSYNPGYQNVLKDLKPSTRQRFVALNFDHPPPETERLILEKEAAIDAELAERLVKLATMTRNLKGQGLDEGASTRLLVNTAKLVKSGVDPLVAVNACIAQTLTDDAEIIRAINELASSAL